jgi:hypothetical protein
LNTKLSKNNQKNTFNELNDKEFNFFYNTKNQYGLIPGMLGVLREAIAYDLATDGSFQYEIGREYCPDDISLDDYVLNHICGDGATQYELADDIIDNCDEEQLKEKMYYHAVIVFDSELERHFPNFSVYNRSGREYYIDAEQCSELSLREYSFLKL